MLFANTVSFRVMMEGGTFPEMPPPLVAVLFLIWQPPLNVTVLLATSTAPPCAVAVFP